LEGDQRAHRRTSLVRWLWSISSTAFSDKPTMRSPRALSHPVSRGDGIAGALRQLGFELARDRLDLLAAPRTSCHYRKARAVRARRANARLARSAPASSSGW
jgi:hypothetical protein